MNKLIGKIRCYFGFHDWENMGELDTWLELHKCKRCDLYHDRDTLLNHSRYYRKKVHQF